MTMDAINKVLLVDAQGHPTDRHLLVDSTDWDAIRMFSSEVYMPYTVSPLGKAIRPKSVLRAASIGGFTLSRFNYGIGVNIRDFSPEAGTGMVLTTIRGSARHWADKQKSADTGVGETFLVDNSRTDYWVDFDPKHLQVNLCFQHDMLSDLYERWFGAPADERLWQGKVKFGGVNSSWMALLEYACRCVIEMPEETEQGTLGKHLEELLGMHLLMQWRQNLGQDNSQHVPRLAPVQVKWAEDYLHQHATEAPTLVAVAAAIGVSVRSLNRAFLEFRGYTPMDFLREERMKGVRSALMAAPTCTTVASVASMWGFNNLGLFAVNYKRRFAESPSQTLRRLRIQ